MIDRAQRSPVALAAEAAAAADAAGGGATNAGTFKAQRERERRQRAAETTGWNAAHVRADAVVDATAARLDVSKA